MDGQSTGTDIPGLACTQVDRDASICGSADDYRTGSSGDTSAATSVDGKKSVGCGAVRKGYRVGGVRSGFKTS